MSLSEKIRVELQDNIPEVCHDDPYEVHKQIKGSPYEG